MREYTTDEIEKALLECSKLEREAAILIEAQQKEISELKKQIAETYTAKQFHRLINLYL